MVKYRMPYDKYVEEHPHLASFVASVNGNDFLTDPTGSRRFLPFEVLSIDIERAKANLDGQCICGSQSPVKVRLSLLV